MVRVRTCTSVPAKSLVKSMLYQAFCVYGARTESVEGQTLISCIVCGVVSANCQPSFREPRLSRETLVYQRDINGTMPCLRSLGKSLKLYDLHVRSQAAAIGPMQTATLLQQRASITDIVCEPATGTPAHPFQPVSSASTTGDTFVPKGAKLSGHGAHPLARYR